MSYELLTLRVQTLICIPDFALTESALEKRNPLKPTARRAGYVGCYISLYRIPADARIHFVKDAAAQSPAEVRRAFRKLKPLASLKAEKRGWTLDVLSAVRSLNKSEFTLTDVYSTEDSLAQLHPKNSHIRPKIRQQLQVLRDLDILTFLGDGSYRLR